MKVIHIASGDLWAGAEVQIATLLGELVREHDVYAIVLNHGRLSTELQKLGVTVYVLAESELSFLQIASKARRLVHSIRPDIVHTHRQKEHIIGGLAQLGLRSTKGVRTVHGSSEFSLNWKQRIQRFVDYSVGRFIQDAVISVSDTLTQELTHEFSASRIYTIANGIDPEAVVKDSQTTGFDASPDCYHVGIAGRIVEVKRVDLFLRAAAELLSLPELEKPFLFHVFGDGPLLDVNQQLAQELGIERHVLFHGHRDDIRSCISRMDVMVMTSDHEGLPMTALESLALGVPLVAHAIGGLKPLLNEANNNGLVDTHEPSAYAKAIVSNIGERVSLPQHFTARHNANSVVQLYQALKNR